MAGAKAYATISAQSQRFVSAWIGDGCKTPQVEATSLYAIWTALPASQKQRYVEISVRCARAGLADLDPTLKLTLLCIDCRGSRGWMRWRSLICCFGTTALYVRIAHKWLRIAKKIGSANVCLRCVLRGRKREQQ